MNFPLIDLHQDLLIHIRERDKIGQNAQTDFEMIRRSQGKIICVTAFPSPPNKDYSHPVTNDLIESDLREYRSFALNNPGWKIITKAEDISTVMQTKEVTGLILHIEGLNSFIPNDFSRLEYWHELGWRSLGPMWNMANPLGGGTNDPTQGLTVFGRTMIEWLQERRMIIDFAHMNEPTFWDAAKITRRPIIISHGNARAICNHPRNYTDEQLRAVAYTDGVVGVFMAKTFITGREQPASVVDVANHIDHLRDIMGINYVAIGTDFGGIITGTPTDLSSLEELPTLWNELKRRGYRSDDLERIAWKNAARVLTQIL